jgi:Kef-type K+ transport system membrane component KefB
MIILFQLFMVLLAARLAGELCHRVGLPSSVGEILSGVLAAAAITQFGLGSMGDAMAGGAGAGGAGAGGEGGGLFDLRSSPVLQESADVAIFALILLAGIEMQPAEIVRRSWRSIAVAIGGVALPLALGIAVMWAFLPANEMRLPLALLAGVALSITALPASIRVLQDLGLMASETGRLILAAALIDDVLGLILMAVILAVIQSGSVPEVGTLLILLGKVAAFFALSITFGWHIYPHIRRGVALMQAMSVELSALILAALAYGALAEFLDLHWVLGPFMAGMFFEPKRVGKAVYNRISTAVASVVNGVLGPLFFFTIGMAVDLGAVTAAPILVASLLAAAFLGKFFGAGIPAYFLGLGARGAAAVGAGMCARGVMVLVILSIAVEKGLIASLEGNGVPSDPTARQLFSALVLTAVVSTIIAPLILRAILAKSAKS